ncbi:hypothetical protein CORC01_08713 [Colletotrichum orchidophilum]|uniref:Uncharacterized protein n=1 Tax=Colletotrichum orchidophilum TaxID=1209926 RepID=A0A1G4B3M4_9PEZI|nr:uncharacterized protein CORC01_08713 [Colletotrichum orchidophilum]OHE96020.1 hypothetical protein CORC01_08713 [Colletotrichum orchidophilum]
MNTAHSDVPSWPCKAGIEPPRNGSGRQWSFSIIAASLRKGRDEVSGTARSRGLDPAGAEPTALLDGEGGRSWDQGRIGPKGHDLGKALAAFPRWRNYGDLGAMAEELRNDRSQKRLGL